MAIKVKHEGNVTSRITAATAGGRGKRAVDEGKAWMQIAAQQDIYGSRQLQGAHASPTAPGHATAPLTSAPTGSAPGILHAPSNGVGGGGGGGGRALSGGNGGGDSSDEWKITGRMKSFRPDDESEWDPWHGYWYRKWLPGEKEAEAQQRVGDVKNSQLAEILGLKHSFERDSAEQQALLNQEGKVNDAKMKTPPAGKVPALQTPFPTAPGGPTPPNAPTPPVGTGKDTITPAGQSSDLQKQIATVLTSVSKPGSSPEPEAKPTAEQPDGGQDQLANLADAIAQQSGGQAPKGPDDIMSIYANGGSVFGERPKEGENASPAWSPFALPNMDAAAGGSDAFAANEYSNYLGGMFGMFFNNRR